MSVALKNLVYGMYSADISKKVRSARDIRVRNGEFVGQFAKNPEDKHELLIDENVAWVVRRIFRQAADGVSHAEIARQLNEEGIPTRYMYHQLKGDNFPDKQPHVKIKLWDNSAVKDIITDEAYLGTMLWNRAKCGMDTNKKRVEQPREKWLIVENQHEALVSKELFQKANDNFVGLDMSKRTTGRKNVFFICGYCGKSLKLRSRKNDKYYCGSRVQQIENDCQKINVAREELENAVLCQVREMAGMLIEAKAIRKKDHKNDRKSILETTVADSIKETVRWKDTKLHLYEQYKAGTITREDYVARIEKGRIRMEELEQIKSAALEELKKFFIPYLTQADLYFVHWPFPIYHAPGCSGGESPSGASRSDLLKVGCPERAGSDSFFSKRSPVHFQLEMCCGRPAYRGRDGSDQAGR